MGLQPLAQLTRKVSKNVGARQAPWAQFVPKADFRRAVSYASYRHLAEVNARLSGEQRNASAHHLNHYIFRKPQMPIVENHS